MSKPCVLIVAVVAVLGLGVWIGGRECRRIWVHDTEFFVASEAAEFVAANPGASVPEIYAALGAPLERLRSASVTQAWFDRSGQLVDPWGSPFLLVIEVTSKEVVVTCTSTGPDRRAGTWDDVVRVYNRPTSGAG